MVKFKIASDIRNMNKNNLVLNPFSEKILFPKDKSLIKSIVGIDCSWKLVDQTFSTELLPDSVWDIQVIKDNQISRLYYKINYSALE